MLPSTKIASILLISGVALSGCATYDLRNPVSVPSIEPSDTAPLQQKKSSVEPGPCEPCWRKIVYRGTVTRGPFKMEKVSGARVSLFEGGEELCTTASGPNGEFELDCEVYGTPCEKKFAGEEWRPEPYYAITVEAPNGQQLTRVLRDLNLDHPLVLDLD